MYRKLFFVLCMGTIFTGCSEKKQQQQMPAVAESSSLLLQTENTDSIFKKFNYPGCIELYDLKKDTVVFYNKERCLTGFIPASTFKIFNSLVALETGVIKDEHVVFKWDGIKRDYDAWNHDQDMQEAFRNSTVWFYQELARRIGKDSMDRYVKREHYGNEDIGGKIDRFWLDGNLRISPQQEIDFLKKLYLDQTGFSKRTTDIVKKISIRDSTPDYILHAKTGWGDMGNNEIGWFVGWVETKDNVYFFATNIQYPYPAPETFYQNRIDITYSVLKLYHIL